MTATTAQDALRLPREQWPSHPNYPRQVLLLGSHESFRRLSSSLLARVKGDGDLAAIGWVFDYWKSGMSGHEHYEEGKLYPYLEARWGLSCDELRGGHHELGMLDKRVRSLGRSRRPGRASSGARRARSGSQRAPRYRRGARRSGVIGARTAGV